MLNKTYLIAEAGVNHNGSLKMARELVDVAVTSGADAIKFQTFISNKLAIHSAPKAEYQHQTTDASESQLEMLQKLELNEKDHHILIEYCDQKNISFLSSPFDLESVDLLANRLNVPRIKIPSGEITNPLLLLRIAQTGKPSILSTGMSTLSEVETALAILAFGYILPNRKPSLRAFQEAYSSATGQAALKDKVVLLHCTTEYPTPFTDVNLRAMDTLREAFGIPVGLSDHTPGIVASIAAVARGAVIIEKHFTLDRNLPGPDHQASLEPEELKTMIQGVRQVEQALGSPLKTPASSELKNLTVARRSLVAACKIQKGELFTEHNLTVKRPGNGVSPIFYWDQLGKVADRNYKTDELIGF